jgi:hypothetical protein
MAEVVEAEVVELGLAAWPLVPLPRLDGARGRRGSRHPGAVLAGGLGARGSGRAIATVAIALSVSPAREGRVLVLFPDACYVSILGLVDTLKIP